ncbi:dihydrodipicolinate synthase family protein [Kribbella soli]|uniref:dihydrodipicolinate synthase family protein n=1 Tax=Kribbella soli TaxID=1124743 RepID=UPI001EDD6BC5|nr:dihydrodipicolinate synthase family protein [Kribbella soli]
MWATLLLPLNADDSIDFARLESQVEVLGRSQLDGLYAHGTAGEFQTLTEDEFDRINELLAAAGRPFQIGASHPSAQVQLSRVRRAAALQPGAIQVIVPDWLPLNAHEVLDFLRRTADTAGDVPLVLYNPPHSKTTIGPRQLGELAAAVPTLIGLKTAGGDKAWFDEATRSRLAIFVPGHFLASMSLLGAHGSYSNVAALSPNGAVAYAADLDVERRVAEFFAAHVVPLQKAGLSNPALDKFLAAVGDWADVGPRVRWPMQSATAEQVEAARPVARSLLPELFGDSW